MMHRVPVWAGCMTLALSAMNAQQGAGPDTLACRQAFAALEAQETKVVEARRRDAPADHPDPIAPLRELRREAALACLGGPPDAVPPLRTGQPTIAAPPPAPAAVPISLLRPAAAAPALPRPAGPVSISSCDATGCWASDGTRLQRAGPNLLGPRGLCTAAGGIVNCP